jgi:hypothetical protein
MSNEAVSQSASRHNLIIMAAFARLDLAALAIASAVLAGSMLFVATAWHVLHPPFALAATTLHLGLLSNYLPGYGVSWLGSVIGLFYGMLIGFCVGVVFGAVWNLVHHVYLLLLARADLATRMDL